MKQLFLIYLSELSRSNFFRYASASHSLRDNGLTCARYERRKIIKKNSKKETLSSDYSGIHNLLLSFYLVLYELNNLNL